MKDHLGSTRLDVNSTGTPTARYEYDPYGKVFNSSVNTEMKYHFTGHEFEDNANYNNFRARFYDSDIALFYAVDPDRQTNSPLGYAIGNPVNVVDPTGRFGEDWDQAKWDAWWNKWNKLGATNSRYFMDASGDPIWTGSFEQNFAKAWGRGWTHKLGLGPGNVTCDPGTEVKNQYGRWVKNSDGSWDCTYEWMPESNEKSETSLANAEHGTEATGFMSDASSLLISTVAGKRIYYTNFVGASKYISSSKVLGYFEKGGKYAFVAGAIVNVVQVANGEKTAVHAGLNIGVGIAAMTIGGPVGFAFGTGYMILDACGTFDYLEEGGMRNVTPYSAPFGIQDKTNVSFNNFKR
jgi:RHS repeat-associated protein